MFVYIVYFKLCIGCYINYYFIYLFTYLTILMYPRHLGLSMAKWNNMYSGAPDRATMYLVLVSPS